MQIFLFYIRFIFETQLLCLSTLSWALNLPSGPCPVNAALRCHVVDEPRGRGGVRAAVAVCGQLLRGDTASPTLSGIQHSFESIKVPGPRQVRSGSSFLCFKSYRCCRTLRSRSRNVAATFLHSC